MEKTNSIFSSARPDLNTAEKEKQVFERRRQRKQEEIKADIYALPYLLTVAGAVMTIVAFFVSVEAAVVSLPLYLGAIGLAYTTKKSNAELKKKIKGLKISIGVFLTGIATLLVFMI